MDLDQQGVVPMISYADGPAAMDWLAQAFGFQERERWLDEGGVLSHGEMSTGRGLVMLATPSADYEGPLLHRSHCDAAAAWAAVPWVVDGALVYVDDVAAHFARARDNGASLLSAIEPGPGGSLLYRAEDLEGHRWMFMQRGADG
jgi:PhnB protein